MSLFDFIPTVGEIFSKIECTLTDHEWIAGYDDRNNYIIICKICGKKNERKA